MIPRSMLFVPGDSERKMEKALASEADAIILDLEDAVAAERLPEARGMVRDFLTANADRSAREIWVRINALESPRAREDLAGIVAGRPDGILLPKCGGGADMATLDKHLSDLEAENNLPAGGIRTAPVACENAGAFFQLASYAGCSPRFAFMTWGAEDFAADLGAKTNRGEDGRYDPPFELARSFCLIAAAAAEVAALDTVYANFRDGAGLAEDCKRVRRAGFQGKLAIHPDQAPVINQAFTPSAEEIVHAERVIAAFAASPAVGVVGLDGRMYDMPHLKQAQKTKALAERLNARS